MEQQKCNAQNTQTETHTHTKDAEQQRKKEWKKNIRIVVFFKWNEDNVDAQNTVDDDDEHDDGVYPLTLSACIYVFNLGFCISK